MPSRKRKLHSDRPHLVLRLRRGWTYDSGLRCFCLEDHDPFRPGADLPKYTRIAFQVPAMARKRKRTAAEQELARSIQIVPPKGVRPERLLKRVQSWPCVEEAWVAPTPSPAVV